MTPIWLTEIEERAKAAAPGPWKWKANDKPINLATYESPGYYNNPKLYGPNGEFIVGCDEYWSIGPVFDDVKAAANGDLIAHAPTDLTRLIAEYRKVREALEMLDALLDFSDAPEPGKPFDLGAVENPDSVIAAFAAAHTALTQDDER